MNKKVLTDIVDRITFSEEYNNTSLEAQFEASKISEKEYDAAAKKRKTTSVVVNPSLEQSFANIEDVLDFGK